MQVKQAFVRAVRTAAQAMAGALTGLPVVEAVTDIKVVGAGYIVAAFIATNAGAIAFLQNIAEDNTSIHIPK